MSDESTQFILGDAAAAASEEIGGPRRFFRRKKKRNRPPLTHCENCGAELGGPYCSKCGQHAIDYHRSLLHILVDAADSFFNWDAKFFKSIGVLLTRPWKLTNDFNGGKRVSYVHPLRLYLLASITFFLIAKPLHFQTAGALEFRPEDRAALDAEIAKLVGPDSPISPEQRAIIKAARARLDSPTGGLTHEEQKIIRAAVKKPAGVSVAGLNDERERTREALRRVPDATPTPKPSAGAGFIGPPLPSVTPGESAAPAAESAPPKKNRYVSFDDDENGGSGKANTAFEKWMEERIKAKIGKDGSKGELFLGTLRNNIPTMMLCCIPIFAFILKVLYIRQRRFYIEHLVYALHIHSFVYLAVVVIVLTAMGANRISGVLGGLLIAALCTAGVCLVFTSIFRVYRQGWFMSLFKFFLGGIAYLVVLSFGIGATAMVTLMLPD